jgi:hypothetical protein
LRPRLCNTGSEMAAMADAPALQPGAASAQISCLKVLKFIYQIRL